MIREVLICLIAAWPLFAAGCGRGESSSPTVHDVAERARESEQRTSDQFRVLTLKCDELERKLAALAESQTAFADAAKRDRAELKTRLDALAEKLDQLPAATKLQMNVPFDIKGTLEESVAELSKFTEVPIRIAATDLAEARIPKIRYVELPRGHRAEQLLQRAVSEANLDRTQSLDDPRQTLVYVMHDAGKRQEVIITTRSRVEQRGALPPIFGGQRR